MVETGADEWVTPAVMVATESMTDARVPAGTRTLWRLESGNDSQDSYSPHPVVVSCTILHLTYFRIAACCSCSVGSNGASRSLSTSQDSIRETRSVLRSNTIHVQVAPWNHWLPSQWAINDRILFPGTSFRDYRHALGILPGYSKALVKMASAWFADYIVLH